jgi:deoxyhypusine synthase
MTKPTFTDGVAALFKSKKQNNDFHVKRSHMEQSEKGAISKFLEDNYKHYNAGTVLRAAKAYKELIDSGGKMCVSLAGAMSTAELGISLAEMIRQDKISMISCTGANLEEDVFNLVARSSYVELPNYRDMTPEDDKELTKKHLNRVTDSAIPEKKAMRLVEKLIEKEWKDADNKGKSYFPHEYLYKILLSGDLVKDYDIDPKNSWMLAAAQKNLPIVCFGWEDSSLGNIFTSECYDKELKVSTIKSGVDYMLYLIDLYPKLSKGKGIGFFQIGGGLSGDAPICVVPLLKLDLKKPETPFWAYYAQVSDAVQSYGGYSGAGGSEKISWFKVDVHTPMFNIESDATIVCPLVFAYVLNQ